MAQCPPVSESTPMWRGNIPALLEHRTVIAIDLLGEAGMLAGLGLGSAHLMGVSIGGWTPVNYAVRRPGRAASLVLLDPVLTFAPIPAKAMLVSAAMFLRFPESLQRRVFSWIEEVPTSTTRYPRPR